MIPNKPLWSEYFELDQESISGLKWKVDRRAGVKAGDDAGCIHHKARTSYFIISLFRKKHRVHRIIYEMVTGEDIQHGMQIDHIDGNGLNNKISNLRLVTNAVNGRNKRAYNIKKNGGELPCGVRLEGNRYVAAVSGFDGKEKRKNFNIKKYGNQKALQLALDWRCSSILELNKLGAGYTERHGK